MGYYTIPIFLNVPCSPLSGSMQFSWSPYLRHPFGYVRGSLFLFFIFSYSILNLFSARKVLLSVFLGCAEWEIERKKGNYREISLKFLLFFLFLDGKKEDFVENSRWISYFWLFSQYFPQKYPYFNKRENRKRKRVSY